MAQNPILRKIPKAPPAPDTVVRGPTGDPVSAAGMAPSTIVAVAEAMSAKPPIDTTVRYESGEPVSAEGMSYSDIVLAATTPAEDILQIASSGAPTVGLPDADMRYREMQKVNRAEGTEAGRDLTEATMRKGAAAEIIASAADSAELIKQNTILDQYQLMGAKERQAELLSGRAEAVDEMLESQLEAEAIYEREFTGIGFIDNIINNISGVRVENQLRADRGTVRRYDTALTNFAAHTEEVARTAELTKKTLNEGVLEARARERKAISDIEVTTTELDAIRSNAGMVTMISNENSAALAIRNAEVTVRNSLESQKMRRKEYDLSYSRHKQELEEWEGNYEVRELERIKAVETINEYMDLAPDRKSAQRATYLEAKRVLKEAESIRVSDTNNVNRGLAALERPPMPSEDVANLKKTNKEMYLELQTMGAATEEGEEIQIALTPSKARGITRVINPGSKTKGFKLLEQAEVELHAEFAKEEIKVPKNAKEYDAAFNEYTKKKYAEHAAEIKAGDATNPYQAPAFSTLVENSAAIRESSLYQKVLEPLGMKDFNMEKIREVGLEAVIATDPRLLSMEQLATGINTIAEAAKQFNNTSTNFYRYALPEQTAFNMRVQVPGFVTLRERKLYEVDVPFTDVKLIGLPTTEQVLQQMGVSADIAFGTDITTTSEVIDHSDYTTTMSLLNKLATYPTLMRDFLEDNPAPETVDTKTGE